MSEVPEISTWLPWESLFGTAFSEPFLWLEAKAVSLWSGTFAMIRNSMGRLLLKVADTPNLGYSAAMRSQPPGYAVTKPRSSTPISAENPVSLSYPYLFFASRV